MRNKLFGSQIKNLTIRATAVAIFALLFFCLQETAFAGWTERRKITSAPRGFGSRFGDAVAVSGNTMVVGARFDSTTDSKAGAAYVFALSGTTWTQKAVLLLASDGAGGDIPAAADFDANGKADLAVFRPDRANWFIQRTTQVILIQQFGSTGDLPTPAALIPQPENQL